MNEEELMAELSGYYDATVERKNERECFPEKRSKKVIRAIELLQDVIDKFKPQVASSFVVLMGNWDTRKEEVEEGDYF